MTEPCLGPGIARTAVAFPVPPGACDSHVHTFGPYDSLPLSPERGYTPPENDAYALLCHLDDLHLARAVVVTASAYGTDNRATLEAMRLVPDRVRGIVLLSEDVTERELDRMTDANVCGVRVNLSRQATGRHRGGTTLDTMRKLAPKLRTRGWHAQIWISADDLPEVADDLEKAGLDLVFDHMGRLDPTDGLARPGFARLLEFLRGGRAWCKISGADRNSRVGAPYPDVRPLVDALVATNPERIVWGSDWPHVGYTASIPDAGELLNRFGEWVTDERLRTHILVENPAKLYGFPARSARPVSRRPTSPAQGRAVGPHIRRG